MALQKWYKVQRHKLRRILHLFITTLKSKSAYLSHSHAISIFTRNSPASTRFKLRQNPLTEPIKALFLCLKITHKTSKYSQTLVKSILSTKTTEFINIFSIIYNYESRIIPYKYSNNHIFTSQNTFMYRSLLFLYHLHIQNRE